MDERPVMTDTTNLSVRSVLTVMLLLAVAGTGLAASPPHHPLSQIYPVDTGLNMSGNRIYDSGGTLTLDDRVSITGNLDMNGNEILNQIVDARTTAPSSPTAGQLWYDAGQNVLKYYTGTEWI
ncbi:MAG: hypothetical protein SVU32_07545, partial [Candidatus Nanohaloarchaea archaeon]|nr:hypothetical protein [Candidatus Nanohaloarchaea archaeon]